MSPAGKLASRKLSAIKRLILISRRNPRLDGEMMKSRIKELQAESEHARRVAAQLKDQTLGEDDIKSRLNELRASMRKSKLTASPFLIIVLPATN